MIKLLKYIEKKGYSVIKLKYIKFAFGDYQTIFIELIRIKDNDPILIKINLEDKTEKQLYKAINEMLK